YHRYGALPAWLALPGILERAQQLGLETAMLEHVTGDADELSEDLTRANVSAWAQNQIAAIARSGSGKGDRPYYLLYPDGPRGGRIALGESARLLAQYFKAIRPGAVRLGAKSSTWLKKPVAFVNVDGTHVLVVNANHGGLLSIRGLPAGEYDATLTT